MNAAINFYKPPGMSSAQAVAFVKRLLGAKTGHAGTLDPEAAGVLVLLTGRATRLCDDLMGGSKQYLAEIAFGAATDTQDAQGRVTQRGGPMPRQEALAAALPGFTGTILQTPPQYSALKTGGEAAYRLARSGKEAPLAAREVWVGEIRLLRKTGADGYLLRVTCGKGTYIRTLCHDVGQALGCPAHLRFLLREKSGDFLLRDAVTPEGFSRWAEDGRPDGQPWLRPPLEALAFLPRFAVPEELEKPAVNGVPLPVSRLAGDEAPPEGARVCLTLFGRLLGVFTRQGEAFKPSALMWEPEGQAGNPRCFPCA